MLWFRYNNTKGKKLINKCDWSDLEQLYWEQQLSLQEIADIKKTSRQNVSYAMRRLGIQKRSRSVSIKIAINKGRWAKHNKGESLVLDWEEMRSGMNVSELQWAYYAGLFDGEGSVWPNRSPNGGYSLGVQIGLKEQRILLSKIKELFGGNVYPADRCDIWKVSGQKAYLFLVGVGLYLNIKSEKCKAGLKLAEFWAKRGKGKLWTDEERQVEKLLVEQLLGRKL